MDIFQGGELSTTLESRQQWVSGLGTCAEPSHRCHDPSYTERPSRKTHGNRTDRPHMSTPPVLLSLGVLSVGLSFVARQLISLTSKLLRCAKHIAFRYITLHYITLHYITLHYITLHYITLHYITLDVCIYVCLCSYVFGCIIGIYMHILLVYTHSRKYVHRYSYTYIYTHVCAYTHTSYTAWCV